MKTRLALVAFLGPGKGPWVRSRRNETGVRVQGLAEGERVVVSYEVGGVTKPWLTLERNDTFTLPEAWDKIMFEKECPGECGVGSTKVELLVA